MLVKSDIISLLDEAFKQHGKSRKGMTQLLYDCPFCNRHDGFKKMEVCIDGERIGFSNCWRCKSASKSFGSLLKKLNAPQHLRSKMFELSGEVRKVRTYTRKLVPTDIQLPEEFISLSTVTDSVEYRNAIYYLKTRGVEMIDILRYNIGYCEEGMFRQQLIIPSYDIDNKLNFYIGRSYYDELSAFRYRKPDFSNDIIGFENQLNWEYDEVSCVEGVFDAFAVHNNAIPLFGKYPQKKLQEKLISNGIKRVNMILDNDALDDAVKNCELLWKYGINVHLVKLDGKDPSKLGFKKVHGLIKDSVPFEWENLMRYKLSKL
jgi:hypothetical protein